MEFDNKTNEILVYTRGDSNVIAYCLKDKS